jgi:hypothetical protein
MIEQGLDLSVGFTTISTDRTHSTKELQIIQNKQTNNQPSKQPTKQTNKQTNMLTKLRMVCMKQPF